MRVGVDNNRPGDGELVFKAGDAADDRERLMSDVPNLEKKFRGPMPMFSCLSFDTEQTSVTSRLGISRLGQSISHWLHV